MPLRPVLPNAEDVRSSPVPTTPPRANTAAADDTMCTEVAGVVANIVLTHQSAARPAAGARSPLPRGQEEEGQRMVTTHREGQRGVRWRQRGRRT